jgi:hypothetical protein
VLTGLLKISVSWESGKSRKSGQSGKSKEIFENLIVRLICFISAQTVLNTYLFRVVQVEKICVGQWDMGQNGTINCYKHNGYRKMLQ